MTSYGGWIKKNSSVNLMSIDFQKAFNRMDHGACLARLTEKGVPDHLVKLVGAFLFNRKMSVKINGLMSRERTVNGGAPQGSILGPYLFCIVSEILAEKVHSTNLPDTTMRVDLPSPVPDTGLSREASDGSSIGSDSDSEWAAVDAAFNFFRRRRTNPLDDTIHPSVPLYDNEDEENPEDLPRPTVKAYIDDFNIIEVIDNKN